jgi:excisionase family DNA binding protein
MCAYKGVHFNTGVGSDDHYSPESTGRKTGVLRRAYRINEFCEAYGFSRSFVYKMIADGRLQTVKVGNRRIIPIEAGEAFSKRARDPCLQQTKAQSAASPGSRKSPTRAKRLTIPRQRPKPPNSRRRRKLGADVMIQIPDEIPPRIKALIPRLACEHDGEVVATEQSAGPARGISVIGTTSLLRSIVPVNRLRLCVGRPSRLASVACSSTTYFAPQV